MAKLLEYIKCLSVGLIFVNVGKTELFFGTTAKLREATISFVMSGRLYPHITTRLPLDGFS
jgi:hypothetical protein